MSYRLQDGVTNLLPASDLVTALVKERESVFAHQMMMTYLKPRLSYNYSRFVTNIGILLLGFDFDIYSHRRVILHCTTKY